MDEFTVSLPKVFNTGALDHTMRMHMRFNYELDRIEYALPVFDEVYVVLHLPAHRAKTPRNVYRDALEELHKQLSVKLAMLTLEETP